jgi:hypothetical protein
MNNVNVLGFIIGSEIHGGRITIDIGLVGCVWSVGRKWFLPILFQLKHKVLLLWFACPVPPLVFSSAAINHGSESARVNLHHPRLLHSDIRFQL